MARTKKNKNVEELQNRDTTCPHFFVDEEHEFYVRGQLFDNSEFEDIRLELHAQDSGEYVTDFDKIRSYLKSVGLRIVHTNGMEL
jgi:hypothetical protein